MKLRDASILAALLGEMLGLLIGAVFDDAEKNKPLEQPPQAAVTELPKLAVAPQGSDARSPESAP
jgi:hypothetical protein